MCLISLFFCLVVIQLKSLLLEQRFDGTYIFIDNTMSECTYFLYTFCMLFKGNINIYLFHMVYQSTSSSKYFFFSFSSGFLIYHLHHYLSTSSLLINLISFSFEPEILWQLASYFRALPELFIVVFWMLWMPVTVHKAKITLWKTMWNRKILYNGYCLRYINK